MQRDVHFAVESCGGSFVVWAAKTKQKPPRGYDDPAFFFSNKAVGPWSITFERGQARTPIATTADLVQQIRSEGSTAETEFARDPSGFAGLAAAILDLSRVVDHRQLWAFLEDEHGVPLADRWPRFADGALRFTIAKLNLDVAGRDVEDVSVDAATGRVERTQVHLWAAGKIADFPRDVLRSVESCGGTFVAWVPKPRARLPWTNDAPDPAPAVRSSVAFERGPKRTPIETTADLVTQLRSEGATAEAELARDPVGFAQLAALILDVSRVVEAPELWSFLDEEYGIPIGGRLPRFADGALRFTIAKMGLDRPHPAVEDLSLDPATGRVERTPVPIVAKAK